MGVAGSSPQRRYVLNEYGSINTQPRLHQPIQNFILTAKRTAGRLTLSCCLCADNRPCGRRFHQTSVFTLTAIRTLLARIFSREHTGVSLQTPLPLPFTVQSKAALLVFSDSGCFHCGWLWFRRWRIADTGDKYRCKGNTENC